VIPAEVELNRLADSSPARRALPRVHPDPLESLHQLEHHTLAIDNVRVNFALWRRNAKTTASR